MNSIKDIIPQVIAPLSSRSATPAAVGQWWQRHYGEGKKTAAVSFKDGNLLVHVDTAQRRVKMEMERQEYMRHVRVQFPGVQKITFKVGRIS